VVVFEESYLSVLSRLLFCFAVSYGAVMAQPVVDSLRSKQDVWSVVSKDGEANVSSGAFWGAENGYLVQMGYSFSLKNCVRLFSGGRLDGFKLVEGDFRLGGQIGLGSYSYQNEVRASDLSKELNSSILARTPYYSFSLYIRLPLAEINMKEHQFYLQPSAVELESTDPVTKVSHHRNGLGISIGWEYLLNSSYKVGIEVGVISPSSFSHTSSPVDVEHDYLQGTHLTSISITLAIPLFSTASTSSVSIIMPQGYAPANSNGWKQLVYQPKERESVKLEALPSVPIFFLDKSRGFIPWEEIKPALDSLIRDVKSNKRLTEGRLFVSGGGEYYCDGFLSDSARLMNAYSVYEPLAPNTFNHLLMAIQDFRSDFPNSDRVHEKLFLFLSQSSIDNIRSNSDKFAELLINEGFNSSNTLILAREDSSSPGTLKHIAGIRVQTLVIP